jgi:hypothetical protein
MAWCSNVQGQLYLQRELWRATSTPYPCGHRPSVRRALGLSMTDVNPMTGLSEGRQRCLTEVRMGGTFQIDRRAILWSLHSLILSFFSTNSWCDTSIPVS